MKLEYSNIDLDIATSEDIKKEIERLKHFSNEFKNEEQAVKILLNSIYGGIANKWMVCFNTDVAESIPLQGQSFIKHAEKIINHYLMNFWHKDVEVHKKLGIEGEVKQITKPSVIYIDTDSNYVCFDQLVESCSWKGDAKELILKLNEYRLTDFLKGAFDRYAVASNTANYQDFELENIAESGIWLAKKKYLLNPVWESGISIESNTQITYKGVELAQSSTPAFAREKLKDLIKFIFSKKKSLQLKDIISLLKKYKEEFKMSDPEKISMGRGITDYSKYILNDSTSFEIAKKTPIHVRAAGYYNYLLNKNPKLKSRYEMIKAGDKIKFYYVKTTMPGEQDVFAFLAGSYPIEFAPTIDYDTQFTKTIIDPINRVTIAMGFPEIGPNLYVTNALF